MFKTMKQMLPVLALMSFALISPKLYANKPGPGAQTGVHFCSPWPSCQVVAPLCTSGTDCPQACDTITVNTATLGTSGCYPSTNSGAGKKSCGLDSAIALANTCTSPSKITFLKDGTIPSNTITLTTALPVLDPISSVEIDGEVGRFTLKSSGVATALDINGNGGTVKISNLYLTDFTGTLIKLENNAKGFRISGVNGNNASKVYDPSLAATNNSDPNVPLFLSVVNNEFTVFAVLPVDNIDFAQKLYFIETTATQDFLSSTYQALNPPTGSATPKVYSIKDSLGKDPTVGAKVMVEFTLPIAFSDSNKKYHVLVNNQDKNANFITGDPITYKDTDKDGIADSTETSYGTDPNVANDPKTFDKFLYTLPTGGVAPCTDGTKFVDCGTFSVAAVSANQATTPAPGSGNGGSGGCSSLVRDVPSNNLSPFVYLSGMALCLGILATRRLRFGRVKK